MSKKEQFIAAIESLIEDGLELSEDARIYFEALKATKEKEKKAFTENGKIILSYMQNNKENYKNLFKAKEIGEGIGIPSKTVSGAMRKLFTDGYVEKVGDGTPVCYSLTLSGIEVKFEEE